MSTQTNAQSLETKALKDGVYTVLRATIKEPKSPQWILEKEKAVKGGVLWLLDITEARAGACRWEISPVPNFKTMVEVIKQVSKLGKDLDSLSNFIEYGKRELLSPEIQIAFDDHFYDSQTNNPQEHKKFAKELHKQLQETYDGLAKRETEYLNTYPCLRTAQKYADETWVVNMGFEVKENNVTFFSTTREKKHKIEPKVFLKNANGLFCRVESTDRLVVKYPDNYL